MDYKFRIRTLLIALIIFPCAFALSACEQGTSTFAAQRKTYATDQTPPAAQTAQLIRQLDAAKELDQTDATDPSLSAVRRQDFAVQAGKADHVLRELRYGLSVSHAEIEDALVTPPRHLTPEMRAQLVEQLKAAQALDDKRAQEILIFLPTDEPAERTEFDIQSQRASEVAKSLEIGESINWANIQQALYVPADPL